MCGVCGGRCTSSHYAVMRDDGEGFPFCLQHISGVPTHHFERLVCFKFTALVVIRTRLDPEVCAWCDDIHTRTLHMKPGAILPAF